MSRKQPKPIHHGGKRSNAGRKPKPETVLKQMEQDARITEAQASFTFVCTVRDNQKVPWGIRLAAAQDIQDRVFGRPKQAVEHTVAEGVFDRLERARLNASKAR